MHEVTVQREGYEGLSIIALNILSVLRNNWNIREEQRKIVNCDGYNLTFPWRSHARDLCMERKSIQMTVYNCTSHPERDKEYVENQRRVEEECEL